MRNSIISAIAFVVYHAIILICDVFALVVTLPMLGLFHLYQWAKRHADLDWKRPDNTP